MKKLTAKQEMFCRQYLANGLNATKAAISAGYNERSARSQASQLLTNLNIQERIQELNKDRMKRTDIDADWVLTRLAKVAERCMQAEPVMVKGEDGMEESGEYKFDSSGANKALELLGKNQKLFTDKVEQDTTLKVVRKTYRPKDGD